MPRKDFIPTTLHYAIRLAGDRWVVTCENIPIACFDSRDAARHAAASYLAAARRRGDCPHMETDDENPIAA